MNQVWLPASACPHPGEALAGELNPPRLALLCRQCGSAWDESTVPEDVAETLLELLERGAFRPRRRRSVLET